MMIKKYSKTKIVTAVFGCLFAIISTFSGVNGLAFAEPVEQQNMTEVTSEEAAGIDLDTVTSEIEAETDADAGTSQEKTADSEANEQVDTKAGEKACQESFGGIAWLVCPTTGVIAKAVDWLYDKIEGVLVVNPVEMKDGSPIYEVWKYMRGITNIAFIFFLLVMVYSQITGLGITNYGLKKTLPKLIIGAILVNLSFIICTLVVDASNIIGGGLRDVFTNIEMNVMGNANISGATLSQLYGAAGGAAGAGVIAGMFALDKGVIWLLIPTILGGLAAVVIGLFTIALRQAVVALLIMISPLAVMAYILPNTEQWFKKWKDLLTRMLVFYPMFSLLFGASSLAGFAIIASASDGFGICIGIAVQIFPLFFSWSLMKMSGTFLSSINARLATIAAKPIAVNRAWAESHRDLTNAKNLARGDVYTPTLRLRQFLSDRSVARQDEISEHMKTVKARGLAYGVKSHYDKDGNINRSGEEAFAEMTRNIRYEEIVLRHKNNFEEGVGELGRKNDYRQKARLDALDAEIIQRSDNLKMETARGEMIAYSNAVGFHNRMEDAINAHMDAEHGFDKDGNRIDDYAMHNIIDRTAALKRYESAKSIMNDNELDAQFAAAFAAQNYDTQAKIIMSKFQKYFELTPPTKDDVYRLREFSRYKEAFKQWKSGEVIAPEDKKRAVDNIDAIISGLRVVNQRVDTDIVQDILDDLMDERYGGVELGTHASQAIASFLMFDVGDNDPFLRRFGKYINLETAASFNKNERKNRMVNVDEYVLGYHADKDQDGNDVVMYSKRPSKVLLEGTSFDKIERTALSNMDDRIKKVYMEDVLDADGNVVYDENGNVKKRLNVEKYLEKRNEIETAIGPQFISASLKYLSGSEQLKSAVKFITGYSQTQKKDEDGNTLSDAEGNALYEWVADWEDRGNKMGFTDDDKKKLENYYRGKTEQYFRDQTPAQILGLRTDYKEPVMRHLTEAWLDEHPEERAELNRQIAEIQTRYGDLPADKAKLKRDADVAKLMDSVKMDRTGKRLRNILDSKGKLEQIYTTKGSGAANNAKDWLRAWLNLNDPVEVKLAKERYRAQAQEKYERRKAEEDAKAKKVKDDSSSDDAVISGETVIYTDSDRQRFSLEVDDLWRDVRGEGGDEEDFFEQSLALLNSWFGEGSFIAYRFEKFHESASTADGYELRDYLQGLLEDESNYPDR